MNNNFSSFIDPDSVGLFCSEAPLSSYLCSMIASNRLHKTQLALLNQKSRNIGGAGSNYWRLVDHHLDRKMFDRVQWDGIRSLGGLIADLWGYYRRGRSLYVYYNRDNRIARFIRLAFPGAYHIVLEHGTDETLMYINECKRGGHDKTKAYLLSFYDQVNTYLSRHHIDATIPAFPLKPLMADSFPTYEYDAQNDKSLFFMSPLVEDWIMTEQHVRIVMSEFLKRRPHRHYLIKPHPRASDVTMKVVCEAIDQSGSSYDLLPPSEEIAELSFVKTGVSEVCSFFSTAGYWLHTFYGIPFDTTIPEIIQFVDFPWWSFHPKLKMHLAVLQDLFENKEINQQTIKDNQT